VYVFESKTELWKTVEESPGGMTGSVRIQDRV